MVPGGIGTFDLTLLIAVSIAITYKSKKIYKLTMTLVGLGVVLSLLRGFDYKVANKK